MSDAIRLGLAGAGRGVGLVERAVRDHGAELTVVADPFPRRRELFEEHWKKGLPDKPLPAVVEDFDALMERDDYDAVVLGTPAPMHAPQAIRALAKGVHVLSEIPAAHSIEEARALVQAVREAEGIYFFAENCCFWHFVREWKRMVREGRLGEVEYVEGEYVHRIAHMFWNQRSWRADYEPIRYCTHETGPLLDILDDRVVEVTAMTTSSKVFPARTVGDVQVALFRTQKGVVYKQLNGFGVVRHHLAHDPEPVHHYYSLYGTKGFLETTRHGEFKTLACFQEDPNANEPHVELDLPKENPTLPEKARGSHGTADWEIMRDFLRCIRKGAEPTIDVYRGLDFSLPGICAVASLEQGGALVQVPDPREF
jgi:predicted dehydrogenase